ncbi:PREDICTED: protein FAM216A isoform X4 [Chinchilla lanigera]|uniref:protein FAM216A isoform X4 n=1 Tax=Chinchilla lanigera TaxID=34839 RepID=UPI00038E9EA6|nr:PREDICTED: protein FAM216A isoform X4 [Chinchilla lanigera]
MPGRGPGSDWTESSSFAEPPAVAGDEGGRGGGSAGRSYYPSSKDRMKDGHKVNLHIAKLQEHPDLTMGQKRYLCSIAKIYNANYLRTLMKGQYMNVIQRSSLKPGVLIHHRSRLSSRYSQKQHYPCTTWRHQREREDSSSSTAASAPEVIIQHSLWRPVKNKEGLKIGYASKIRCKSLKIFRRPSKLFMQSVSSDDSGSYMNEEKKEDDLLNKSMQSMSIEEQGDHLMLS